ncbi:fungal specific transcription factor domain-containing protein [Aspergillus stella-maris]|uniref:fungal specific transcription factor domain-containing protein n=1 Tax=Aspergillus stella-maris TaxID=1810926 RepID=UPI003CCE0AA3
MPEALQLGRGQAQSEWTAKISSNHNYFRCMESQWAMTGPRAMSSSSIPLQMMDWCRSVRRIIHNGSTTCVRCTAEKSECVFDVATDQRRRVGQKRKVEDLEQERDVLLELLEALRDSPNNKSMQLLNLIRSNASLQEIKLFMDHELFRGIERSPELLEVQETAAQLADGSGSDPGHRASRLRHTRSVMDIKRLTDTPVFRVPAKPWTSVKDDDEFVSHLISLWFTRSQPFYNWVHREVFLADMKSGNIDSQFCSPFLVNYILCEACFHSDYPEAYETPGDCNSKGLSITAIQGCGVLFVCMAATGKDRVEWWYLGQLAHMVEEFAAKHAKSQSTTKTTTTDDGADRAISTAIWGVYNLTAYALHTLLPPPPPFPPLPPYAFSHAFSPSSTPPSETDATPINSHTLCILNAFSDFSALTTYANAKVFKDSPSYTRKELSKIVNGITEKLDTWRAGLPSCISLERASVAQALSLHMDYHTVIIILWGLLKKESTGDTEIETETEDNTQNEALQALKFKIKDTAIITRSAARERCISNAVAIANILETHRNKWSMNYISPTTIHWVSMSLFTLLEDLDSSDSRKAFIDLCVIARAFSRKWILMKGILRMIQVSAKNEGVVFPDETKALFMDFESLWREKRDGELLSSLYPNPNSLHETGGDRRVAEAELDSFLEKWDSLGIEEEQDGVDGVDGVH